MIWFLIFIPLLWIFLAVLKSTHVLTYLGMLALGIALALLANAIVGNQYEPCLVPYAVSVCHNYTFGTDGKGRDYITYFDLSEGVYTKQSMWVDFVKPMDEVKEVQYHSYLHVPNPDCRRWGWQFYYLVQNSYYYQLEVPPSKLPEFVKGK